MAFTSAMSCSFQKETSYDLAAGKKTFIHETYLHETNILEVMLVSVSVSVSVSLSHSFSYTVLRQPFCNKNQVNSRKH